MPLEPFPKSNTFNYTAIEHTLKYTVKDFG